jgi:mRNA interferase MazF
MEVTRGDVWLMNPGRGIGSEMQKPWPAVIVQNDIGNRYSPMTIIVPISSSKTETVRPFEVLLDLKKESKALCNHVGAIDKRRLIRKLGRLDNATMAEINEALKVALELT